MRRRLLLQVRRRVKMLRANGLIAIVIILVFNIIITITIVLRANGLMAILLIITILPPVIVILLLFIIFTIVTIIIVDVSYILPFQA